MKVSLLAVLICLGLFLATNERVAAQTPQEFSRKNTFSLFAEYANDSSHIVAGYSRQRKLADFGVAYVRRLARFKGSEIGYLVEVRPVLFESDPVANGVGVSTITSGPDAGTSFTYGSSDAVLKCVPFAVTGNIAAGPNFPGESYIYTQTCGRQWTFGQAFTPVGFKYSMRTHHRLQPFVVGTAGHMYTSRPHSSRRYGGVQFHGRRGCWR